MAFAVFLKISKTNVQDVHRKTPPSSGFQLCSDPDGTTRSSWCSRGAAVASLSTSEPQCKQQHPSAARHASLAVAALLHRDACTHLHICGMITCVVRVLLHAVLSLRLSSFAAVVELCLTLTLVPWSLCALHVRDCAGALLCEGCCIRARVRHRCCGALRCVHQCDGGSRCHVDQSQTRLLLRALGWR